MNMNQKKIASDGKTVNYERFKEVDRVEQLKKMKIRRRNHDVECVLVLWVFRDFFYDIFVKCLGSMAKEHLQYL